MSRFHINPETGVAGACRATTGNCPFGSDEAHYATPDAARAAYEQAQGANIPTATKRTPDLEIPAPTYEVVIQQVLGKALNTKCDILVKDVFQPVRGVKLGYKYATVTVPDLKKGERNLNLPLNEAVTAQVKIETKESKAMRTEALAERSVVNFANSYVPKRIAAVKSLQEHVDKGYLLAGSQISDLVEAEAKDSVMEDYKRTLSSVHREEPNEKFPYSRAVTLLQEDYKDAVIMGAFRSNSVSTSEAYNLFEREKLSAKASFLNRGMHFIW